MTIGSVLVANRGGNCGSRHQGGEGARHPDRAGV